MFVGFPRWKPLSNLIRFSNLEVSTPFVFVPELVLEIREIIEKGVTYDNFGKLEFVIDIEILSIKVIGSV